MSYRLTTLVEFSKLAKGHSIRIAFPGRQVRTTTTSIESIVAHMPVIELSITVLDHLRFGVHVQEDSLLNLSSFVSLSLLALLIASWPSDSTLTTWSFDHNPIFPTLILIIAIPAPRWYSTVLVLIFLLLARLLALLLFLETFLLLSYC